MSAAPTSDKIEDAASPPMLHRIVSAGHLRYWIICSWGLTLATVVRLDWVIAWAIATLSLGVLRGQVDSRAVRFAEARRGLITHGVATLSCIAWAAAPLMAWIFGTLHGEMLAVGLLAAGYTLVFTQMRSAPREALIVSSPYSVVLMIMISSRVGTPDFWSLVSLIPVLAFALLIKVVVTQIRDREIRLSNARQIALIQELKEARDRADAASTAKSNFLGVISHELRTPMNGVLGAAQLLDASELKADQRDFVGIIQKSGESLLALLNDILDITKIEAGKMEAAIMEVSMTDLHQRVIGPFRAHAEAKGLTLVADFPNDAPGLVRTDPLRLGQIVQNFLSNAIKFTSEGEVTLTMTTARVGDDRARLTFIVEDQGMGIAQEDLARLFQPFTQVDASSTRRFSGTGLGLSIAKRMAELLGGDVRASSQLNRGSIFEAVVEVEVLDWNCRVETETAPAPLAVGPSDRALCILVAEDHPVNRLILETFLTPLGHDVVAVENGRLAVEQAGVQGFDLIIMDVNMPVMDGLSAIREIRRGRGPNQATPIAVLSASARGEDHQLGLDAGADAYLDKPVDFGALIDILEIAVPNAPAVVASAARARLAS